MSCSKAFKVENNNSAKGFGKLLHVLRNIFILIVGTYLMMKTKKMPIFVCSKHPTVGH